MADKTHADLVDRRVNDLDGLALIPDETEVVATQRECADLLC